MQPLLILGLGTVVVLGAIVVLRIHAFIALIAGAIVVSLLAPGPLEEKIARVAEAFGQTAGSIAIVIALAAVIGQCMMASGAADRVVRAFLNVLGEKRGGAALAGSGFVLSIPVFFDTVFYLLIPLVRSLHRRTGRHYLRYLTAIVAGAAATHTLVPPTPGPMLVADSLGVDLGLLIVLGVVAGLPATVLGVAFGRWLDGRMPLPMRPLAGVSDEAEPEQPVPDAALPSLTLSVLPILLPVILISAQTIASRVAQAAGEGAAVTGLAQWTAVLGNPNFAMLAAAVLALGVYVRQRGAGREQTSRLIETALMAGGVIILITSAGGAFGAMLRAAEIGPAIEGFFADRTVASDLPMLFVAFFVASLLKFAQGSSTVAMITAAGMIAAMIDPASLSYNPAYLAIAIGGGSLVGSWMNDSGFWIYCKMGATTEAEALRSWTPLLIVVGSTSMVIAVILAIVLPMPMG